MAGVSKSVLRFGCALLLLSGCALGALGEQTGCDELAPGDVVITEVQANPKGSDGTDEYIELFNASDSTILLDGLVLTTSRADAANPKRHRFIGAWIEAGDYFVAGNAESSAMPAHLDYSYGSTLGSLRNSDAVISLRCGDTLLDAMSYARTTDGRALQLDGRLAPDHRTNDEPSHWCAAPDATAGVLGGNFGTPGAPNSPCESTPIEGTCWEGERARAIVVPKPGELRIAEWMANPIGADSDFEWVELVFEVDADLNGVQLGPSPDALRAVVEHQDCVPIGAGDRVVFGASPAAAPRVDAELHFSLANSGSRGIAAGVDGVVLDQVSYQSTIAGRAWQVDSDGRVCLALADHEYTTDNFGTPGEANPRCPPELGPGMCLDGEVARDIVSPGPGEAWITEWMANPAATSNRDGEWVEIRFDRAVDLNGLVLSDLTSSAMTIESDRCLPVSEGAYVVMARNLDPQQNGGIDDVTVELSLSLNNSDESIALSVGDVVLDQVMYERSEAGAATQIDELGNICDAVSPYGDGDLGTPGSANPSCS